MCTEKYVSPFTDFGFKRLFGSPQSKQSMVAMLNALLDLPSPIQSVDYASQEHLGMGEGMRNAVFDIYCTTKDHEHIIVEMQNAPQKFFIDRSIFYSTFPLQEAARKGKWKFDIPRVYTVCFLNFVIDIFDDSPDWKHVVKLCDIDTGRVFSQKLCYYFIELPKFQIALKELQTPLENWVFLVKNINKFEDAPEHFSDEVYLSFIHQAELAKMSQQDRRAYEESLKEMRDYLNTIDFAEERGENRGLEKGKELGRAENARAIAKRMLEMGMSPVDIARATGLSEAELASSGGNQP